MERCAWGESRRAASTRRRQEGCQPSSTHRNDALLATFFVQSNSGVFDETFLLYSYKVSFCELIP
jgi:hypothetical protein